MLQSIRTLVVVLDADEEGDRNTAREHEVGRLHQKHEQFRLTC